MGDYGGKPRLVVVGAGVFGGWSALKLLRAGARVTLVDAWGPGHARAGSGGEGRAIRGVYGGDRRYVEMVARAFEGWSMLERDTGRTIYQPTGALWMTGLDDGYVQEALPILADLGFPIDTLTPKEAARRWPQIHFGDIHHVYLEQRAGALSAREACSLVRDLFVKEGGDYRQGKVIRPDDDAERLSRLALADGSRLEADGFLFALGAWMGSMFPDLLCDAIQPTRQEIYYFGTPAGDDAWSPHKLPTWIDFGTTIRYGFPDTHGRGFKFADDTRGAVIEPTTQDRRPTPHMIDAARAFIAHRFPALADAPLVEARVCQYANSPDGNLILDRHPTLGNVWLAGGGSGHGYKLGPAIGDLMTQLILEDRPTEPMFGLARLDQIKRETQFQRRTDA